MGGDYRLYSRIDDHETILELWGASTKHPDSVFLFSNFDLCPWIDSNNQIVSWIFECASKLTFPFHSYYLAKWACDMYENAFK